MPNKLLALLMGLAVLGVAPTCCLAATDPFDTVIRQLTTEHHLDPVSIEKLIDIKTKREVLSSQWVVHYEANLLGASDAATFGWAVRAEGDEKGRVASVSLRNDRPDKASCEKFEGVVKEYGFTKDLIVPTHGAKFYFPATLDAPVFKIDIASSNESEPCIEVLTATTSK